MSNKTKKTIVIPHPTTAQGPEKLVLISNTTCKDCGTTMWKDIYDTLEKEKPKVTIVHITIDESVPSGDTLNDLSNSFLHRIMARSKIFPYTDMVKWVIESINITDRALLPADGRMFGSFKPKDLKRMYHFP